MGGRNHCIVVSIWYIYSSYRVTNLAKWLKYWCPGAEVRRLLQAPSGGWIQPYQHLRKPRPQVNYQNLTCNLAWTEARGSRAIVLAPRSTDRGYWCSLLALTVFQTKGAGLLGWGACALGLGGWLEAIKDNLIWKRNLTVSHFSLSGIANGKSSKLLQI